MGNRASCDRRPQVASHRPGRQRSCDGRPKSRKSEMTIAPFNVDMESLDGGVRVFAISGELDQATASALREPLQEAIDAETRAVVIDMTAVRFHRLHRPRCHCRSLETASGAKWRPRRLRDLLPGTGGEAVARGDRSRSGDSDSSHPRGSGRRSRALDALRGLSETPANLLRCEGPRRGLGTVRKALGGPGSRSRRPQGRRGAGATGRVRGLPHRSLHRLRRRPLRLRANGPRARGRRRSREDGTRSDLGRARRPRRDAVLAPVR